MNYTEIYVDNTLIDLGEAQISLPISYSLVDIKNLNKRSGSKTKTISVPRTAKNDKIFGVAYDINAQNSFDKYTTHLIRIEENTEVVFNGLLKLTGVTVQKIEFFCFAELSKFKGISGTKTLQDLRLSDLDHTYDETIFGTWDGTYPIYVEPDYFYPVIDYGQFYTRTLQQFEEPPEADIFVVDLYPAVYLKRLIKQICLDNGYTLVTTFFDDPQLGTAMLPFVNENFVHDLTYLTNTVGFRGYTSGNTPYNVPDAIDTYAVPVVVEVSDPLNQFNTDEYTAASAQRVTLNFQGFLDTTGTYPTGSIVFVFQVEKWDDALMAWGTIFSKPFAQIGQAFGVNYSVDAFLNTNDKIRVSINRLIVGDITKAILVYVTNYTVIPKQDNDLTILEGETVQLAPNLPAIKQADLFKWCAEMFFWVIDVNDSTGVITIESFTDFYINNEVVDMSAKLNLAVDPVIRYDDPEFSRKYDFKYTPDDKDYFLSVQNGITQSGSGLNFGDGKLYLSEQGEATLIGQVGFSPTVVERSFNGLGNYLEIPIIIDTSITGLDAPTKSTNHTPRILLNAGLASVSVLSGGTHTEVNLQDGSGFTPRETIPLCYFQKRVYSDDSLDAKTLNLSFQIGGFSNKYTTGNLIDLFYRQVILSLLNSAQVTAYFDLRSNDVSNFNFRKIWYVDYFEANFRINLINNYLPAKNLPTQVELIKVGVVNNVVTEYGN